MNRIEQIYGEAPTGDSFARGYLNYLVSVIGQLDVSSIANFIDTLMRARDRGARVFFIGNGGSAATASHFANDVSIGSQSWTKPFRAMSLTDNVAILTAANRMVLMPFAQVATRIGGAITVTLVLIVLSRLV